MGDRTDRYRVWENDNAVLAEIGVRLFSQPTRIRVRLPMELAARASAAWDRDDDDEALPEEETHAQRLSRHRAGSLALIGLAVAERGMEDGDDVVVDLGAWQIGESLNAAEDAGLLARAISDLAAP